MATAMSEITKRPPLHGHVLFLRPKNVSGRNFDFVRDFVLLEPQVCLHQTFVSVLFLFKKLPHPPPNTQTHADKGFCT